MKLWDFKKTHSKAWSIGRDHAIEAQFDRWPAAPLFGFDVQRRGKNEDHAGIRLEWHVLRWTFSVDYYSIHHADRNPWKS